MSDEEVKSMSTYERLSARFPAEVHKKVNKGGGDQTYVPAVDIFNRVDEVLTPGGWQARVIREGMTATEAWVLAEVAAYIDGELVVRQQYGCEPITVGRDAKPVGDLFKKAATDAYKKCLTLMGVARYLYDADERREVEAEMREASRPKPQSKPATEPTPIRDAAVLTGANPERAENVKKVQTVMRMALAEGIEFEQVDPTKMADDALAAFGKDLADKVRAARAAKAS
jgi:hypothetical protein